MISNPLILAVWDCLPLESEKTASRKFLRNVDLDRRFKLSHDPNNTAWSRSATKYGQKILQSHGWTPGDLLGASGATYSDLRSAASASHIRIALKDDNLGLGAKHHATHKGTETTGLDGLQDLLGRLNGRSPTDLQKDGIQRSNWRSSAYINERWGNTHFISGGLLVQDDLKGLAKGEQDALSNSQQTPSHHSEDGALPEADRSQELRPGTSKRSKHNKRTSLGDNDGVKKTGNKVDWKLREAQSPRPPLPVPDGESQLSPKDMCKIKKVRKHAERTERRLKRQTKREARNSLKAREQSSILPLSDIIQRSGSDSEVVVASNPLREISTSARDSHALGTGRLAVRHRYVQHKKMCMMDHKALNEVSVIWPF